MFSREFPLCPFIIVSVLFCFFFFRRFIINYLCVQTELWHPLRIEPRGLHWRNEINKLEKSTWRSKNCMFKKKKLIPVIIRWVLTIQLLLTSGRFTLQKIFGTARVKLERVPKKCASNFIYTTTFIPWQNFWAPVSSLGDMRSSVISKNGRRSLRAESLKEDVSQDSKLDYEHRIWHKFAGKNTLP